MPIHILDERLVTLCGAGINDATTTKVPSKATCSVCINNYETAPQPATTADLLEVLRVAAWLAREGPPRTGGNPARAAQAKLEAKLARPRRAKPEGT